jgi:hypothetical protein
LRVIVASEPTIIVSRNEGKVTQTKVIGFYRVLITVLVSRNAVQLTQPTEIGF